MPIVDGPTTELSVDVGVRVELEKRPQGLTRAIAIHNASRILFWNAFAIPLPLRTEAYTHALIQGRSSTQEDPSLAAMFRTVETQTVLERGGVAKVVYLGATALRQNYSDDPKVQREQLHYIANLTSNTNNSVRLHVLPAVANANVVADKPPMTLFERRGGAALLEEETWSGGVVVTDDLFVVSEARTAFAALHTRVLNHDDSVAYLRSAIDELPAA